MKKSEIVHRIFHDHQVLKPKQPKGLAFAPTNIALCKYWGKRDPLLNLPVTSSLSVSLPDKGALTSMMVIDKEDDVIILNGVPIGADTSFKKRTSDFLNLFRGEDSIKLHLDIQMNIPVAAGLASSACGFASIVASLNDLCAWQLQQRDLSILARIGSGSAARSLWNGFVEWHAGVSPDGMDSYGEPLPFEWPELLIGLLPISHAEKSISSRQAMLQTVNTSALFASWPRKVMQDLIILKQALHGKNFSLLGGTSESNALAMHATMLSSWPPICYFLPETIAAMHKIWQLRKGGLPLYFTEDAGPNLKLLFLDKDKDTVVESFPEVEVIQLFDR
ncbi:MAG: diphosphomevalonate decarboxylase [Gammaproteobacteria bacterium]|nr:diphosphomevalonate decarboxylase [Gammaproteobacteria bacterium]